MKETVNKFKEQQKHITKIMNNLKDYISTGSKLGIIIDPSIIKKLETVAEMVADTGKLRVALIGGFSEGKTSIAAAWMERFDTSTMKISQAESSDEVNVYSIDSDIELVDTPGLFGFKEKFNPETKELEKYKDITQKYVSEAHLVIYVMNPTNPIKDSHKEELIWLFRTLNLLPRTVFVLSRFDEVADVEDEQDYLDNLHIKQSNVIGRLKQLISLTPEEEQQLVIVGIAANPFEMGLDHWLNHKEEFRQLSRISSLQEATVSVIDNKGGYLPIVCEMQKSIAKDILEKQLPISKKLHQEVTDAVNKLESNCDSLSNDLNNLTKKINRTQSSLITQINDYMKDVITQLRGCGLETIQTFLDAEIGLDGCVMNSYIQNIFRQETQNIENDLIQAQLKFNADINQFDSVTKKVCKNGLDYLKNSEIINSQNIIKARDGIVSFGKMLGDDIGKTLATKTKFKPWGAKNLAGKLTKALQILDVLIQVWDEYKRIEAEKEFQKGVNEMVQDIQEMQKTLLELVSTEDFAEKFFPKYISLKQAHEAEKQNILKYKEKQKQLEDWYEKGHSITIDIDESEIIDVEFTE